MTDAAATKREKWILIGVFLLALGYNLWGVSYHFTMGFMAGHEFRQAQTAITSYYIDHDNNFGLLYETPILGKPWVGLLLEVPVYEWSVVGLSRLTGWEHVVAARAISVTCFYVMLGGVWQLLGCLGVARVKRLLFLALILATPVYIFYSRAFLMDAMALMGSVWWLYAFLRVMRDRDWRWLGVAIVAGSLSALIKGAVFAIWMVPGAAYGVWVLWQEFREKAGWKRILQTTAWGLGTVVVALGLLEAWLAYTDPIKAAHASAWIFTSENLSLGNWGLFSPQALFSRATWGFLLHCWDQAILGRWLLGAVLVLGLILKRSRWWVLGIGGMFFMAQFMMPYAFAYQDYYYYICALFAVVAMGQVVLVLLETKHAWSGWLLLAGLLSAQVLTYRGDYYQQQSVFHQGGYPFTAVIRDLTPENSVIVVAGVDWAAMTPLYSERRALMVRRGLEYDRAYLKRAFEDLAGEQVSALVVWNEQRHDQEFISEASTYFGFDPAQPTFSWEDHADIYIAARYRNGVRLRLLSGNRYPGITLPVDVVKRLKSDKVIALTPEDAQIAFKQVAPRPFKCSSEQGFGWMDLGGRELLSVPSDTDIWLKPPVDASRIEWGFGIVANAYQKDGDKTDGVVFRVVGETEGGSFRVVYERLLDPVKNAADRGDQHAVIPYTPLPGESLRFSTRGNKSKTYDWAYSFEIKVQ